MTPRIHYPKLERSLVPEVLRRDSWSSRELVLPMPQALEAVDAFERAGARTLSWEVLTGLPDRQIEGEVDLGEGPRFHGWSPDCAIDRCRHAMESVENEFCARPDNDGKIVLFSLMIMGDELDHKTLKTPTQQAVADDPGPVWEHLPGIGLPAQGSVSSGAFLAEPLTARKRREPLATDALPMLRFALRFYWTNAAFVITATVLVTALVILLNAGIDSAFNLDGQWRRYPWLLISPADFAHSVLGVVAPFMLLGLLTSAVLSADDRAKASVRSTLRSVRPRLGGLLATGLALSLAGAIGLRVLELPGIVLHVWWLLIPLAGLAIAVLLALTPCVVVGDGLSGMQAFKAAMIWLHGHGWKVFWTFLAFDVAMAAIWTAFYAFDTTVGVTGSSMPPHLFDAVVAVKMAMALTTTIQLIWIARLFQLVSAEAGAHPG